MVPLYFSLKKENDMKPDNLDYILAMPAGLVAMSLVMSRCKTSNAVYVIGTIELGMVAGIAAVDVTSKCISNVRRKYYGGSKT